MPHLEPDSIQICSSKATAEQHLTSITGLSTFLKKNVWVFLHSLIKKRFEIVHLQCQSRDSWLILGVKQTKFQKNNVRSGFSQDP